MPEIPVTSTSIVVGSTHDDIIETNGDSDWFRIELAPNEWVRIAVDGSQTLDTFLTVYDSDGNPITSDDYIAPGNTNDAEVFFGGAGGTYYVEVASYDRQSSGAYTLTAEATPAPTGSATDVLETGLWRGNREISIHFVGAGDTAQYLANTSAAVISEGWTAYERARVEAALATIAAVTGLSFVITTDPSADFQLIKDTDELLADYGSGLLGYFYLPGGAAYGGQSAGVFNASGTGWTADGLAAGGLGFSTLIHEFLHGLGLSHPHQDPDDSPSKPTPEGVDAPFFDLGVNGINQEVYSIMSYNDGLLGSPVGIDYGHAASPMALDIAVLQQLYGANMSHEVGDTIYVMDSLNGFYGLWDAGGTDMIRYSGSEDVVIDLREADLSFGIGGGGFVSQVDGAVGGFTIAPGAAIENADGGLGNDLLIGNDDNNTLTGNGGSDVLIGGDGDDTLNGESGADTVEGTSGNNTIMGGSGFDTLTGGVNAETIYGGSGNDTIDGGSGNDLLFGGRGTDSIDGGDGDDTIVGGSGQDTLTGGAGTDVFVFSTVRDSQATRPDTVSDFTAGTDQIDLSGLSTGTLSIVSAFSNTVGEIVLNDTLLPGSTTVQIDLDGDGAAEMAIFLDGATGVDVGDFIL